MRQGIPIVALGHTASLFLAMTFTVCVLFGIAFPTHAMFEMRRKLLPGFRVDQLEQLLPRPR